MVWVYAQFPIGSYVVYLEWRGVIASLTPRYYRYQSVYLTFVRLYPSSCSHASVVSIFLKILTHNCYISMHTQGSIQFDMYTILVMRSLETDRDRTALQKLWKFFFTLETPERVRRSSELHESLLPVILTMLSGRYILGCCETHTCLHRIAIIQISPKYYTEARW